MLYTVKATLLDNTEIIVETRINLAEARYIVEGAISRGFKVKDLDVETYYPFSAIKKIEIIVA